MSVQQMRDALKKVYPGPRWSAKVDKMSDNQVIAVYNRLLNNKKKL